jgi:hypothetical protein
VVNMHTPEMMPGAVPAKVIGGEDEEGVVNYN